MYDRTRGRLHPTGIERPWGEEEIIVSMTDPKGHITYANEVFQRVAQMSERELLGKPHNIIRHPAMPRCVFKLIWDILYERHEIFAYVNNIAKSGDNYWVFAHIFPNLNASGNTIGYTSFRRKPVAAKVARINDIYATLLNEEAKHASPRDGINASCSALLQLLNGMNYDQFVFSI
jgi:PAS domain S-box-containing protein